MSKIPIDDCPAGPALDAAAARAMGWEYDNAPRGHFDGWNKPDGDWESEENWKPSKKDESALVLVDASTDQAFILSYADSGEWFASFWIGNIWNTGGRGINSRPLAITRAFCKARGITEIEVSDATL